MIRSTLLRLAYIDISTCSSHWEVRSWLIKCFHHCLLVGCNTHVKGSCLVKQCDASAWTTWWWYFGFGNTFQCLANVQDWWQLEQTIEQLTFSFSHIEIIRKKMNKKSHKSLNEAFLFLVICPIHAQCKSCWDFYIRDKLVYTVFRIKCVWKQKYHMKQHTILSNIFTTYPGSLILKRLFSQGWHIWRALEENNYFLGHVTILNITSCLLRALNQLICLS